VPPRDGLFLKADVSKAADVDALYKRPWKSLAAWMLRSTMPGSKDTGYPSLNSPRKTGQHVDINLKGVWLCLKYEIRQMLKQGGGGAIVNMASVAGMMGLAGAATYSASKHGVIGSPSPPRWKRREAEFA